MPRQVKHSVDAMLDAARDLIFQSGAAGITAVAVAETIGAPSGSIYHRFPRRDDLVASAWLRAQERFAASFGAAAAAAGNEPGVTAAVSVLTWTQQNPADAAVLLRHSLAELLRGDVSPSVAERARAGRSCVTEVLRAVAAHHEVSLRDAALAVVDVPYSVVRRSLDAGRQPTRADVKAVRRAARLLLSARDG